MKKNLTIFFFVILFGGGLLFTGCNTTDLSSLNSQIAEMQQDISDMQNQIEDLEDQNNNKQNQIDDLEQENATIIEQLTFLNQTITDLQTRLNEAEEDVSSLQSQLAISIANYNELYNRVYGQTSNYKSVGDTWTYSVDGIKIFDFTIESAKYSSNLQIHFFNYSIVSYVDGISSLEDTQLGINFLFYDNSTNEVYEATDFTDSIINLNLNVPNDTRRGVLFIYLGNTIVTVYDIDFDEIAS